MPTLEKHPVPMTEEKILHELDRFERAIAKSGKPFNPAAMYRYWNSQHPGLDENDVFVGGICASFKLDGESRSRRDAYDDYNALRRNGGGCIRTSVLRRMGHAAAAARSGQNRSGAAGQ